MTGSDRGEHPGSDDAREAFAELDDFTRCVCTFEPPPDGGHWASCNNDLRAPVDRLRARVAELETTRDVLAGGYSDAMKQLDAAHAEIDQLRAELSAATALIERWFNSFPEPLDPQRAIDAWREAVRGDTPTVEPGSIADLWCGCSYPVHNRGERESCPPSPAAAPTDGQAPADEATPFAVWDRVTDVYGRPGEVRVAYHIHSFVVWDDGGTAWMKNDQLAAAPADDTAAPDERTLYELQVPPPPPAHVTAVQPTSHSDGPWRRDGDDWVRGPQRCTWDELMWTYSSRGRGVEPVTTTTEPEEGTT